MFREETKKTTIFLQITLACGLIILLDLISAFQKNLEPSNLAHLANLLNLNNHLTNQMGILAILIILLMVPLLNEDMDKRPFFLAIFIRISLHLFLSTYSWYGIIAELILRLSSGVVILWTCGIVVLYDAEFSLNTNQFYGFGILLLCADLILQLVTMTAIERPIWTSIVLLAPILGIGLFFHEKYELLSLLLIGVNGLNLFFMPSAINGWRLGSLVLLAIGVFFFINYNPIQYFKH